MTQLVNSISSRLSLRTPQRESMEILERVCQLVEIDKSTDIEQALRVINDEFPTVEDFERDFPSLCFALATGVGKTRLMGAFIAYLHALKGIRHFFVLAPNLTIYNKLVRDFTPNTPKYVLRGIGEFATMPPLVITGDDYEDGRGTRSDLYDIGAVHINVFNISKINSEVRGGKSPRMRRLSEYIGQSYFDYLAGLDDLVMLMDESHRYRASAGVRAINELKPILGLEFTATPQVERGQNAVPFKNVIYSYPLREALNDGYVKEPAVVTRENFDADNYNDAGLERLKLMDGIRIHENTKAQLEVYARDTGQSIVKPFMLVVAQNTEHANSLVELMSSDEFFEGQYRDKVITVHSGQSGEEKDNVVSQLLTVEDPANPTEIVVHVNMLKEGWDVTNLYTIVPLRAANSRTLVEQSIGRGLRLPYGRRVGVPEVDRLSIVSHDRFQEIIDEANNPNSIIKRGIVIGRDIPDERAQVVTVAPTVETTLVGAETGQGTPTDMPPRFQREEEKRAVRATLQVIRDYERLPRAASLAEEMVQEEIAQRVQEQLGPLQLPLEEVEDAVDIVEIVRETTATYIAKSINIPRIIVVPKGEIACRFNDFDLDLSNQHPQPIDQAILVEQLHDHERFRLEDANGFIEEERLEDYLVRGLIDFDDIDYDEQADFLYKLAGQVVAHLRSYLASDEQVVNVLQYRQNVLVNLVHSQVQEHYVEDAAEFEVVVSRGFTTLTQNTWTARRGETVRDFRTPVDDLQRIRGMLFGGFERCLYPVQKFDSDPERRFAVVLENEQDVLKWFRPSQRDIRIHLNHREARYEPDFVVETEDQKYLCEVKRDTDLNDPDVQAKARAAALWCHRATEFDEKRWTYLLIPDRDITAASTLAGLAARNTIQHNPEQEADA